MTGGDCDHRKVIDALDAAGLTDVVDRPPLPSPKVGFYRAVHSFEAGHRFVRKSISESLTYHLIDEREGEAGELAFTRNVKLSLNAGLMVEGDGEDPENLTEAVTREYLQQLTRMSSADVSAWLVKQIAKQDAVPLRPSGGFYFVPKTDVPRWRALMGAMHASTSYRLYEIPAMPADETVEAILDAIIREAKQEADTIGADLRSGELGARALDSRAARAEACAAKVERYEELLGRRIEDCREQLEQLGAASVTAAMKARADEDKDR
jgi:hypothetical protein